MSPIVSEAIAAEIAVLTPVVTPPPADGYGRDLKCVRDLTPRADEVEGPELLAQDLFHRIDTARGLLPDDLDYGMDLAGMLSAPATAQEIETIAARVEGELQKDDRVGRATCTIARSAGSDYAVSIHVEPEDPATTPFDMLVSVVDGAALLEAVR